MVYVLLALATVALVAGGFLVFSAATDRRTKDVVRMGRLMRGGGIETLGVLLWTFAWSEGAKPSFTLPVLIVSVAIGSMAGLFHGVMTNRRIPPGHRRR